MGGYARSGLVESVRRIVVSRVKSWVDRSIGGNVANSVGRRAVPSYQNC